jgi:hypothetical protein
MLLLLCVYCACGVSTAMDDRKRRWDFDKRLRKNFIGAPKAKTRANEIGKEIDRREWRERAETYLRQLSDARASLVNDVSNARSLTTDERRRWCQPRWDRSFPHWNI